MFYRFTVRGITPKLFVFWLVVSHLLTLSLAHGEMRAVLLDAEIWSAEIRPLFLLPSQPVHFKVSPDESTAIECGASAGSFAERDGRGCLWQAPRTKGTYTLTVKELTPPKRETAFHVFVLVPFEEVKGESLNGYRIGSYPEMSALAAAGDSYRLPEGFIEVTQENENTPLTPHFALKQFVCKQQAGYPKYVVLEEKLLIKLDTIIKELNAKRESKLDTLVVMSGYRTPHYNKAIDNVKLSRHIFGDAADIYIPREVDAEYKRFGVQDVSVLYQLVHSLELRPSFRGLIGGMGRYGATSAHPPFLHVDVRGRSARW